MKNSWYTKSMKDDNPKGKIHLCGDFGDITYCNQSLSKRWMIDNLDINKVTCKKCLYFFHKGRIV